MRNKGIENGSWPVAYFYVQFLSLSFWPLQSMECKIGADKNICVLCVLDLSAASRSTQFISRDFNAAAELGVPLFATFIHSFVHNNE